MQPTPTPNCPHHRVEVHAIGNRLCVVCVRCLEILDSDMPIYSF